jgi:hypothetical protein
MLAAQELISTAIHFLGIICHATMVLETDYYFVVWSDLDEKGITVLSIYKRRTNLLLFESHFQHK